MHHVVLNQQTITLASVNNHSQNGIAEQNICTICDRARTMLFHAIEHWPASVTIDLWPFALKMAVDIDNSTPGPYCLSPAELFSRAKQLGRQASGLLHLLVSHICTGSNTPTE